MGVSGVIIGYQEGKYQGSFYNTIDSEPYNLGIRILKYLKNAKLVNGYHPLGNNKKIFNGIDDLLVRLLCYLKKDYNIPGNLYLQCYKDMKIKDILYFNEYVYIIEGYSSIINIKCYTYNLKNDKIIPKIVFNIQTDKIDNKFIKKIKTEYYE